MRENCFFFFSNWKGNIEIRGRVGGWDFFLLENHVHFAIIFGQNLNEQNTAWSPPYNFLLVIFCLLIVFVACDLNMGDEEETETGSSGGYVYDGPSTFTQSFAPDPDFIYSLFPNFPPSHDYILSLPLPPNYPRPPWDDPQKIALWEEGGMRHGRGRN